MQMIIGCICGGTIEGFLLVCGFTWAIRMYHKIRNRLKRHKEPPPACHCCHHDEQVVTTDVNYAGGSQFAFVSTDTPLCPVCKVNMRIGVNSHDNSRDPKHTDRFYECCNGHDRFRWPALCGCDTEEALREAWNKEHPPAAK